MSLLLCGRSRRLRLVGLAGLLASRSRLPLRVGELLLRRPQLLLDFCELLLRLGAARLQVQRHLQKNK